MIGTVVSLFLGAIAAPWLHRIFRDRTGWVLALLPTGIVAWAIRHWSAILDGKRIQQVFEWAPSLNASASFVLDGLSMIFLLLICGIGTLILIYASRYLDKDPRLGRFYAYLLLFMGAMVGLVLADNVLALFVFWELTSISSFLPIGWNHHLPESRKAALTSLLVTAGGGMMLMAGLVLLGFASGSFTISEILAQDVREHPLYLGILILVLGGAFTKSAQVPFHFWLPGAMAAPTPVSAYLHSATMVKAGIYLLARLHPALGSTDLWFGLLTIFGGLTMLTGAIIAVTQTDLKRILAYSTVSVLGLLTLLLGVGTELAIQAAMAYLVAHSLYKGALFLVAGIVDHETGTRDITRLGGLARRMPVTATAAFLAAASGAGLAPLFGFVSKELFYEAAWQAERFGPIIFGASFGASLLMVVVSMMVAYRPFTGDPASAPNLPHEAPPRLWLGPLVLGVLSLAIGFLPFVLNGILSAAANAVSGGEPVLMKVALWHGFTPILGASVLTVVLGVALFFALRNRQPNLLEQANKWEWLSPGRLYDNAFSGILRFAEFQTKFIQSGYLRNYILIALLTLLVLVAPPLLKGSHLIEMDWNLHLADFALVMVISLGTIAAVSLQSRLAVAVTLGAIGIVVMLIYVTFGAMDLAVTQIMVETLTVILLVLVLYHLPRFVAFSSRWILIRDAVISLLFGCVITILVLKAYMIQPDPSLREYFVEHSYTEAHGRNVVNVILVDFRAMDTMGEITVLAVAGIGVYALLKIRPIRGRKDKKG